MRRFEEKVAIVTGAGSGIGLRIAHDFAADGAKVVVADINEASGERAVEEIMAAGGEAVSVPTDVSDEAQVEAMVETVLSILGGIDILVNNAGITIHKLLVDLERDAWDRQLDVQLTGPFLTTKHVGRHMIAGGGGKIVNISSVASVMGRIKCGPHSVSKGGLNMLTKVAALELAEHGVNVNAVAPGLIDVPAQRNEETLSSEYKTSYLQQVPLGRIGLPSDIANMVLFLASDEAKWITGQIFLVDGGLMSGHYTFQGTHDYTMLQGNDKKESG